MAEKWHKVINILGHTPLNDLLWQGQIKYTPNGFVIRQRSGLKPSDSLKVNFNIVFKKLKGRT